MSPGEMLAVILAGVGAGTINAVVGSGTLITFPVLLALGVPPVTANVSNTLGLVPGGLAGAAGYRRELRGRGGLVRRLLPASVLGGLVGAGLLLVLPAAAFRAVVPVLIGAGLTLVVLGPRLQRHLAARSGAGRPTTGSGAAARGGRAVALLAGVALAGVYGGYFGAAQGVILIGLLGTLTAEALQPLNAVKNVLATVVNAVAALVFILARPGLVDWTVVGLVAVGSVVGGLLGARVGRRLPPTVLRAVIVAVGVPGIVVVLRG